MALCYWALCRCPDKQPCTEHVGFHCSLWNGQLVQRAEDVNDPVTRDAELALVVLDDDSSRLDAVESELEAKRARLERQRSEIARGLAAASIGERAATVDQIREVNRELAKIDQEFRQVLADLDSLGARVTNAGSLVAMSLIVPYANPVGYCACYDEKRRRLDALAGQRALANAQLAPVFAQQGTITSQILGLFTQLPKPDNPLSVLATVTLVAAIVMFLLFGTATAAMALLAGMLHIAVLLAATAVDLVRLKRQILKLRRHIVRLDLAYYRLQSITTCQPPAAPGAGGPSATPPVLEENAWWLELNPRPVD